jgi:hypothetical protein
VAEVKADQAFSLLAVSGVNIARRFELPDGGWARHLGRGCHGSVRAIGVIQLYKGGEEHHLDRRPKQPFSNYGGCT